MKGRRPKPTHLKVVTGNPGRRRLNAGEPTVTEPLGNAPADWKPPAKALWYELSNQIPAGVATKADRLLVELTVRLVAKVREKPAELTPALASQIRACLSALGMTPGDRARLSVAPPDGDGDDPFEQYKA